MRRLVSSDNVQKQIMFLFLLGVVFLSIIFSKSRGGIFSVLVSLLFFYLVSSRFLRKGIEIKWMIYAVLTVALFFGVYMGLYPIIERYLLIEGDLPSRTLVWKDIITIIKDFPLFGTGLGTFGYIYPLYKVSILKPVVYLYSHNDYLQILAETGLAGFLSLMFALALFVLSSIRNLVRLSTEQHYSRFFLLLGALTGIFSILIHSFVDFNLQIPSNGLYFAFLIGFSVALGSGRENE
jgi:O-antigen ligase